MVKKYCLLQASALLFLINNGTIGEKYNISGEKEVSNLELQKTLEWTLNNLE